MRSCGSVRRHPIHCWAQTRSMHFGDWRPGSSWRCRLAGSSAPPGSGAVIPPLAASCRSEETRLADGGRLPPVPWRGRSFSETGRTLFEQHGVWSGWCQPACGSMSGAATAPSPGDESSRYLVERVQRELRNLQDHVGLRAGGQSRVDACHGKHVLLKDVQRDVIGPHATVHHQGEPGLADDWTDRSGPIRGACGHEFARA